MSFKSLVATDHTIVIAEIGINHNGSITVAKQLIEKAKLAGVDAVKFQFRNLENTYLTKNEIGDEILSGEINRTALTENQILGLTKFAKNLGLWVGISFFDARDVEKFGEEIGYFDFFKVPSVELTNDNLIDKLLYLDKYLLISTGASDENTLEKSFSRIENKSWMPLHCVSNYPTATYNSNLGYIKFLTNKWNRPTGYSSHDLNWSICVAAITLGAKVIERHITLDKNSSGLDHTSSSTVEEFKMIVDFARNKEVLFMGNDRRVPNQGELLNLQNLGRSYFAKRIIKAGELLTRDDFNYLSPKTGLGNLDFKENEGARIVNDIEVGEVLSISHIRSRVLINQKIIDFANSRHIGLPVRLHDYEKISNFFGIDNYEFHLSFGEIDRLPNFKKINKLHKFTVHLPDYLTSNLLINPFSTNAEIKSQSRVLVNKSIDFAKRLSDTTGSRVGIVGSFSIAENGVENFYQNCREFITSLSNDAIYLAIQWLPPVAWYFGGSVKLDLMNNLNDVNHIIKNNINIVIDTSHLFMGEKAFNFDGSIVVHSLKSMTRWYHISGASGIDGEGSDFTSLNKSQFRIMKDIISNNSVKIVEVWQGHLDKFFGFQQALENIHEGFNDE